MPSRYNPAGHRSTLRVLSIFEALSATKSGLTMAEICRIVGAPKSSLFSILHTMADSDYVSYDETTGRYSIGLKTYLLGKAFDRESGGLSSFETAMRKVVASCGETCQLGVLDHGRVLYISRVDSPQHIRLSSEIGKTLPAHCTAIGKAILSRWDEELVRSLLPFPFEKTTEYAVKHIDDLMRQLEEVRRCGFAYDHQEMAEGVECVAVPIEKGGRLYGLSVSVPAYRFDTEVQNGVEHALSDARDQLERVS